MHIIAVGQWAVSRATCEGVEVHADVRGESGVVVRVARVGPGFPDLRRHHHVMKLCMTH